MSQRYANLDAAESVFFDRQLEFIKTQVYPVLYPELKARQLLPVNSVGDGVDTITFRQEDQFGSAAFIADYADDLPYADVKGEEVSQKVRDLGVAFRYSVKELRAAARLGMDLPGRKAMAARKAAEMKLDSIASLGDSTAGLSGILAHTSISASSVANPGSGTTWAVKTPDQILTDLNEPVSTIRSATNGVHGSNLTYVVPEAQYVTLAQTRIPDMNNTTILDFFLRSSPFVREVIPWYRCKTAGAASADRMLIYERNPDVVTLEIPSEFEIMEPQAKGLSFTVPCRLVTAGILLYRPKACLYRDGI
jgi:hypothetical protein